jgi:endonuclease/exonuclease/phosphatase family metal-dependent hydrolase
MWFSATGISTPSLSVTVGASIASDLDGRAILPPVAESSSRTVCQPVAVPLRVMTWNVWWRFGPWPRRQPAIAAAIRAQRPDVVCLQEVWGSDPPDRTLDPRGIADQAAWLAGELGLHALSATSPWFDGGTFTNAVLSRWPIELLASEALPRADGTPGHRRAVAVAAQTPWGPWPFVSTHLDHRFDASSARCAQARHVLELVARVRGDPARDLPPVVGGDLNAVPDSDEIRLLTGRTHGVSGVVLSDAWEQVGDGPGHTWRRDNPYLAGSAWPDRRLDYVLVAWPRPKPVGNPIAAWLAGDVPVDIDDAPAGGRVWASDHAAVVVELTTPDDADDAAVTVDTIDTVDTIAAATVDTIDTI